MNRIFALFFSLMCIAAAAVAQDTIQTPKPTIVYTENPKKYVIEDIQVTGLSNYEDYVLIGLSGLTKGQTISVPGDEITAACNRYWKHGLFSDVKITAEKIEGNKIWLKIWLTQRPKVTDIRINGVKKSEREDLQLKIGMVKGGQITPNVLDRASIMVKRYFDDKGFKNAEINIRQTDDREHPNQVYVDIDVNKHDKIKVNSITFEGNHALSANKLKRTMKKTNEKGKLINIFRTKKFVDENFAADKQLIIDKYNELGYRDAMIVADSVKPHDDKTVDVYIKVDEGDKYFLRNVTWVGNTIYPSDLLNSMLRMEKGDVYNQKKLTERLQSDDNAVGNLYYNNGYIFAGIDPVEINIVGDSIDLEMRVTEGPLATYNRIVINGNDRVYDNVIRRELRTKPGALFSREEVMRSARELAQIGHFDPEHTIPEIVPQAESGTVDLTYNLISKANDQIEFSAGWGQTGVIGKLSLKFTNFSFANLFRPGENYRGFLPQGDGQTLTISGQTNADYYQQYSISFFDPWFGGKRPNSFSVSAYFSLQTDISDRWYTSGQQAYMMNMYNGYGGYGGYGGYYDPYYSQENYYDPDKSVKMYGLSAMWGKRLNWPDDAFSFSAELSFQRYILREWRYFPVTNGNCNNLSLNLSLSRSSIFNPIFPRSGSEFSLTAQITPPYSLFDGVDYSKYDQTNQNDVNKMHKWVEYHKWKFKAKTYTPLSNAAKPFVLMTRVEYGLIGYYNKYKKSPFETFEVGGDGMTGYSSYATETIALRGYENGSLASAYNPGYAYSRLGLELRYPLMMETSTNIYATAFLEAGNAWQNVSDFNPFNLKRSAGVGVRIFLPMVGMMGIDWAYGFDKVRGSGSVSGSQFHFVLGQEF